MKHFTMKTLINICLCTVMLLTVSCASHYDMQGVTSVQDMEGKTLYLKIYKDNDMHKIDSCVVTHGKFNFHGSSDSTVMASLYMGDLSIMPVVVEDGDIVMSIDESMQNVTGSELNDSLFRFIHRKTQVDNLILDLPRKEGRMVMDGMDHDLVVQQLEMEYMALARESEEMYGAFIQKNYNNVLGPGVFMIWTSSFRFPAMTPQIEELLMKATPYFRSHPYVREWERMARENSAQLRQQ